MILTSEIPMPQCRRGEEIEQRDRLALVALVERFGVVNVAKAADVSVQSIAKALSGMKLYRSTLRRIRAVLPEKVA
jgi:hypothetical protein